MKLSLLSVLAAALLQVSWCDALAAPATEATVISVRDFGATGDGVHDDRPAIQAAIDALAAKGGGVLRIPGGTYLLDSYCPGAHPWGFHNLLVGSHIHIEGEPGATLLQGENGRAPLPDGATSVGNSVLVVGTALYAVVTCQNPDFNGGFYPLLATVADSSQVQLARPTDAGRFAAGDYVAIYSTTTGDVLPSELTRITAVSAEGVLTLASPLARSFATPVIANVTRLITSDVSLKNLTIQGAVPLTVMETYGFSAEDCRFLADTNVGGSNIVTLLMCNTMRSFRFVRNEFGSVGPGCVGTELPQRNSQDGLFEENTFRVTSLGFGEYGAHWRFIRNHMWLYPNPQTAVAISISGLDVLFSENDVHCEKLSGGEGWGSVLTDFYAPGDYAPYVGRNRVTDNTFDCELAGAYCIRMQSQDPVVSRNHLRIRGSGAGIRLDGFNVAAVITDNEITVDSGAGIMVEGGGHDTSTVSRNRITATRGTVGIHVAWPSTDQRIEQNAILGFAQDVVLDSPLGSVSPPPAAEVETFTGIASATGTHKRPLLLVGGQRYELKAADGAQASVADTLARFSQGETGTYVIKGRRATLSGRDGIIVEAIAPAAVSSVPAQPDDGGPQVVRVGPVTYTISAPTVVLATPLVTANVVTVGSDRYTVYSYDDHLSASYVVVIPEGLKTVRGLLVNACYSGGDSRWDWPTCEYYRQFMHLHGFALVATTATAGAPGAAPRTEATPQARHRAVFQAFEDSMRVIAAASLHPELANAPYVGVGFSAGGGFALNLMVFAPEKTIAVASYSAPYMFKRRLTSPPSDAVLKVPSICIAGEYEGFNVPLPPDVDPATGPGRIYEVFVPYRPLGAQYAYMERQGIGHTYDENRQDVLGMPLLDAAVRARYPKDADVTRAPIKLIDLDPASGWIADHTTWKSGLTSICPAPQFKGDLGQSSWLQNEDLAFIYRAYSTYDKPLTITSPGNCWPTSPSVPAGSDVTIVVDASRFPDWKKLEFYDGAKKLGEVTQGPAQLTATNLTPGYHVFSVLGTDGAGTVRTSDPALVVVRNAAP